MKILMRAHLLVFAILFFLNIPVHAQHKGISFQAVIKDPEGAHPSATGLSFTVQILDPVTNCILREEQHTGINVTNGYVNLVIGGSTAAAPANKNPSPILNMLEVMDNSKSINGFGCTYNPSTSHARKLRLIGAIPRASGGTVSFEADFNMRAVAYAINAETLNGKSASDLLAVNNAKGVTQANAESIFERFTKLDGLLNNSSANGTNLGVNISGNAATATTAVSATTATSATTAATATTITGGINTLLPAQGTHAGKYLKTDGTSVSWETVSGGGGGGLTQVGIDLPTSVFTNAADITANGKVTATFATQTAKTFFSGPASGSAVPTFRTLTTSDIGSFNTDVATIADTQIAAKRNAASGIAGLDGTSKIPVTLLPNDAVFSSSAKAGTFKLAGPSSTEIQLSAPAGLTSYDIVFPTGVGSTGQFLKINSITNSGKTLNMAWDASVGGLTQVGIDLPTSVFTNAADITANGKVAATFATQTAKTFFAGPASGTAAPTFRTLTTADVGSFNTDAATIADTQIAAKRNAANGIAGLDADTKIPTALLPNDAIFTSSVKTGTFKIAGPTTTEIQIAAPLGLTSYDIVLPTGVGTAGQFLKISSITNSGKTLNMSWDTVSAGGGGTLTSVGLSLPTDVFTVTNSPLTADGSISASLKSQTQYHVLAAPNTGNGTPTFRQLQVSDLSNAKSAALYDVPVTGDAGTTQVVKGDDSRLINTRTPTDNTVTTAKIAASAVTDAKIDTVSASKLTGNVDSARLPAASNSADGIVNQIAQSFKGVKTFVDNVIMQGTLAVTGAFTAASVSATGAGSFDYVKVATSAAACNGTTEGALRYNSTSKKMEFCNGTAWGNIANGTVASLAIGNPSSSVVKSGPVTFDITYGGGTDSGSISLNSGHITIGGTATTGCTVSSVTGTGLTRTVTVNSCSGTGTVSISVAAGTANSTTGDAALAAGPSNTYIVDNTGPSAPTALALGSVPTGNSSTPTITYTAGVDSGGSTVASHQVQITKNSDSSVVLAWTTHTSGASVTGLSLSFNTAYSVSVRAVDAVGNTGTASSLSSWTTSSTLWPAQYGSGWTLSGATATNAVGSHSDGTYAVGQLGPSSSYYFDMTIDSGYTQGKVGFIGVTTRDGTASMNYTNTGYTSWYYGGSIYRDNAQPTTGIEKLEAGTYRIAVNFTDGKMYIKRTSGTPTATYSGNLPTGWTTTNLRPFIMSQSTYPQITTTTLTGFTLGSGGLYP